MIDSLKSIMEIEVAIRFAGVIYESKRGGWFEEHSVFEVEGVEGAFFGGFIEYGAFDFANDLASREAFGREETTSNRSAFDLQTASIKVLLDELFLIELFSRLRKTRGLR